MGRWWNLTARALPRHRVVAWLVQMDETGRQGIQEGVCEPAPRIKDVSSKKACVHVVGTFGYRAFGRIYLRRQLGVVELQRWISPHQIIPRLESDGDWFRRRRVVEVKKAIR